MHIHAQKPQSLNRLFVLCYFVYTPPEFAELSRIRSVKSSACDFLGINADALAAAVLGFKAKNAVNLCKQRIVLTDADVIAGMEMCAALPYEDVARKNELTVRTLGSQTLGFTFTTVTGAADALLMCEKLQIDPEHS